VISISPLNLRTISRSKQYAFSLGAVLLIAAICFVFSGWMGYRVAAFILLLTVSMLAVVFDILPVLAAAFLSALVWDLFFIPPRFTLHVDNAEDSFLLAMYFIIALINAIFTYKIRQAESISRLKEERANSVTLYNTVLNSLSHELNTPIAAIIAAVDNLQTTPPPSEDNRKILIQEIGKASFRLNEQVENLLNISRLESGHIKPKNDWIDIVELLYGIVKKVEDTHPGRKVKISVRQDLPLVQTDKGMLEQIVANLLNNAAIHTEPSCSISLSASCHADLLEITITDSGKGFTRHNEKDIFEKFSRSKQMIGAGSGLGLSIVKGFTEALGGTVELDNAYKNGSQFQIAIPVKTSYFKYDEE
jgi:two-component system, OmpR family, sensor histidine kinase KdpD